MHLGIRAIIYSARKWKKTLLVFCLLYTPCVAAITSIKRELGGKWAALVVVLQCVIAWLCAFAVYIVGGMLL